MRLRFAVLFVAVALALTAPAADAATPHAVRARLARLSLTERQAFTAWSRHVALEAWYDAVAAAEYDWPALARCETGSDFTAHGSKYSSAYGVMNEAVRENAPAAVAERILAGRASVAEQTRMAIALEHRHGIRSWGCWRAAIKGTS